MTTECDSLDLEPLRLLPPNDDEDPAQLLLTGTGLTHLGSAEGRDKTKKSLHDVGSHRSPASFGVSHRAFCSLIIKGPKETHS